MLKLFYGSDNIKVRESAFSFVDAELAQGKTLETLDSENYQTGIFNNAAEGISLFGSQIVYVVDTPSQDKEMYEAVFNNLENFSKSPHTFVVIEGVLLAPEKKKFSKYANSVAEFKAVSAERFNTFAVADALSRKDKKSLWLLLNEAKLAGIALEELVGILWWQLKTLRLVSVSNSAAESGLKDFPYNKAKRSLGKFKEGELEKLSHSLLSIQHNSRLGVCELDIALERWILRV